MAKVYTIARKTVNYDDVIGDGATYTATSDAAWTDKLEASRALRAMGGGKEGDNSLVLWSFQVDAPAAPVEPPMQTYAVMVYVEARTEEEAHNLVHATGVGDVGDIKAEAYVDIDRW